MSKRITFALLSGVLASMLMATSLVAVQKSTDKPQLGRRPGAEAVTARINDSVRHELAMLPYIGVFDWIEWQAGPDGVVTLRGQVTRPTKKSDAEYRIKQLESVSKLINRIEVLPLSNVDDAARIATYRAIFNYNGPLFRYSIGSTPPIRIIVKNGNVTLKGLVANSMDKQLAYTAARGVPGVFDVKDELQVEKQG